MRSLLTEALLNDHENLPEHLKTAQGAAEQPRTQSSEQAIWNKNYQEYIGTAEKYVAKEFLDQQTNPSESQWAKEKGLLRKKLEVMAADLKLKPPQIHIDLADCTEKLEELYSAGYRTIAPKNPKIFIDTLEQISKYKEAQNTPKTSPRSDDGMFEFECEPLVTETQQPYK